MNNQADWIIIAKFGRPHGVRGWVNVISHTEPQDNVLMYPDWYIKKLDEWVPLQIAAVQAGGKNILAKVVGHDDRESAAALTNKEIAVQASALPALSPGEYYWFQLIGLDVINLSGEKLGEVVEIRPTGANDVLVVKSDTQKHLIPYLRDRYIVSVDVDKKCIVVDWQLDY